jgi:hypothetical protein
MKLKQIGSEEQLSDGTFKNVVAADLDGLAEKCNAVHDVLIEVTDNPQEGIIVLVTLLESLKKEFGFVHVEVLEHPPGEVC